MDSEGSTFMAGTSRLASPRSMLLTITLLSLVLGAVDVQAQCQIDNVRVGGQAGDQFVGPT
jgi:hypothetical protein